MTTTIVQRCRKCGDPRAMGGELCPNGGVHELIESEVNAAKMRELARDMNADEVMLLLCEYMNFAGKGDKLAQVIKTDLQAWHPTLQQNLMRAVIDPAVRVFARTYSDDRNAATAMTCKAWLTARDPNGYPFV